ncbi:reverse transcriptase domain-containing protein [Tanacetum coccineum]
MDSQFQSLKDEMNETHDVNHISKNDDTLMCERHYIQYEVLNNDVKNDLEDFKICIRSMRTVHDKLFTRDDAQHSINDFVVINIPEEDVEPKQIILDPDDQPMWESAKTVAPTPNSAIIQLDVDDNFVINSTHLKMIWENKFDGYLRADPHDHIREFLAICDMFKYGETQSEAVKRLIFPFSLCDEAKTWFNDLNKESITSWEQMRKAFINKFFPPSLFNHLLLKIRRHGLTKGAIIQILYHTLDEPTQEILDGTAGGIFLYKSPNQAFQFLRDKVLFKHDWPIKSKNKHHRKSVSFADGSDSNTDNSRFMEKLKVMDSPIISLNEELQDIRNKYSELREGNASKNHLNDDTPMCEQDEANYIQSEGHQNRISHDSYSHQSHHDRNDSEKSLTKLNNDVRNDLEDFKRCIHSMRTVHWKLFTRDNGKTPSVLPNIESKTVNQEPQSKTDLEKSITKFLDGQRVTNMFFKNNVNNMILKMKQNEKNFQTKIKNMERKMDEWEKYQNISFEQTYRTDPPPPQAHSEQVNAVFTERGIGVPRCSELYPI